MQLRPVYRKRRIGPEIPRIQKDNNIHVPGNEFLKLIEPKVVSEKRFIIGNCPALDAYGAEHTPELAKLLALTYKSAAVANHCGYILVKHKRWNYEFSVLDLNRYAAKKFGNREGSYTNEMDAKAGGGFVDTTKDVWSVPRNYNLREHITFPAAKTEASL